MATQRMQFFAKVVFLLCGFTICLTPRQSIAVWQLDKPIATYSGEMSITDTTLPYIAQDGYNLVTSYNTAGVDYADDYNLAHSTSPPIKVMYNGAPFTNFQSSDLTDPTKKALLDNYVDYLKAQPSFYGYYIADEPNVNGVPQTTYLPSTLRDLTGYLNQRDPNHLVYINLSGFDSRQDGASFPTADSYNTYVDNYVAGIAPKLLSYDNYQFMDSNHGGDLSDYLMNLRLMSQKSKYYGTPFINTVQASKAFPAWRTPTSNELRFLAYSSLAYGAKGISWFGYAGGASNTLNPLTPNSGIQAAVTTLNKEFINVAKQTMQLNYIGTYLKGYSGTALPPGAVLQPEGQWGPAFDIYSLGNTLTYSQGDALKGALFGLFDPVNTDPLAARFILVENNDYSSAHTWTINGPGANLSTFDPTAGTAGAWTSLGTNYATVTLQPGAGILVGVTSLVSSLQVVPEPSSLTLLAMASLGIAFKYRRKRVSQAKPRL